MSEKSVFYSILHNPHTLFHDDDEDDDDYEKKRKFEEKMFHSEKFSL